MLNGLYCLMFEGPPMLDVLNNLLFDTAQEMLEEGEEARTIRSGLGEGQVTTKNEQATIGGMCGTVFETQLDTVRGSFKARFLVRPSRRVRSTTPGGRWRKVGILS